MVTVYSRQNGERKFGGKFEECLADLERTQWYSNEMLRILQDEKLCRLIWLADRFVPFYRESFQDAGVSPSSFQGRHDLSRMPIIDKTIVQSRNSEFRSARYMDPAKVLAGHTSGTTGKPLDVFVDRAYLRLEKAFLWLQRGWCGVRVGDRSAQFTGQPVISPRRKRPPFWVEDRSENRTVFSLQHMSRENMPAFAEHLVRINPVQIVGYPTAIYLMALHLRDAGIESVRPRGVFTASETLLPHQRKTMEEAFGCRVMDLYGLTEYCGMVMQCDEGNYHVQEEYGVLEILGEDGREVQPGSIGEIVCTGLNNMAMPFIRYRTGDMAVPKRGACACGRGGALLERISGRLEDIVVTPDGRFLSRLDFIFKEIPCVQEAQIIQETKEHLRVRIVARDGFSDVDRNQVTADLKARAGDDMRVDIEIVDCIPRLSNGKFRYVVSKVPLDFGAAQQTGQVIGMAEEEKTL